MPLEYALKTAKTAIQLHSPCCDSGIFEIFPYTDSLLPHSDPMRCCYFPNFTDEEGNQDVKIITNLPKVK